MTARDLVFGALDNLDDDLIPEPTDQNVTEVSISLVNYCDGLEEYVSSDLHHWVWEWLISRGHVN